MRRERVTVDGVRISYLRGGEGPPVVLLHGGGLDAATVSWRDVAPALIDEFTVFAPDWPGYGESDPAGGEVSTTRYVDVLGGFLDALGLERVTLAGVSLGGGVAIGYALGDPDRVERLVAVDSYGLGGEVPGGRLAAAFVRVRSLSRALWWVTRRSRRVTAIGVRAAVHPSNPVEELVEDCWRELRRPNATLAWQSFQRSEVRASGLATNYVERLPELELPALFVHGEADRFVPVAWATRAAQLAPEGELRVLAECGHWAPRERPEAVVEAIRAFR
jgi:pimeloyl-ACP methyl ester carboxylesterase